MLSKVSGNIGIGRTTRLFGCCLFEQSENAIYFVDDIIHKHHEKVDRDSPPKQHLRCWRELNLLNA